LMGLRLAEGVDLAAIGHRFGIERAALVNQARINLHVSLGLVRYEADRIAVTRAGMPLLDALLGEIVADGLVSA